MNKDKIIVNGYMDIGCIICMKTKKTQNRLFCVQDCKKIEEGKYEVTLSEYNL